MEDGVEGESTSLLEDGEQEAEEGGASIKDAGGAIGGGMPAPMMGGGEGGVSVKSFNGGK